MIDSTAQLAGSGPDTEVRSETELSILEFAGKLDQPLSTPQGSLLSAQYGLRMNRAEKGVWRKATGGWFFRPRSYRFGVWICGRRSGKSLLAALCALYEATVRGNRLPKGEWGRVLVAAPSRSQAKDTIRYISNFLDHPYMAGWKASETEGKDFLSIRLVNNIEIVVGALNPATLRGGSLLAVILEEFAHAADYGSRSASEILAAVTPGLNTTRGLLLQISTPGVQDGPVFEAWQRRNDSKDIQLVWQLDSFAMNPTVSLAEAKAESRLRGPLYLRREYYAEWTADENALLGEADIARCIDVGVTERPPVQGTAYVASVDAALGRSARGDEFGLAIAHLEGDRPILDLTRTWAPPFDARQVWAECMELVKRYGCFVVYTDQVGYLAACQHHRNVVKTETLGAGATEKFDHLISGIDAGLIRLLDNSKLVSQLRRLRQRREANQNEYVEARGGHDDLAIAAVVALWGVSRMWAEGKTPRPATYLAEVIRSKVTRDGGFGWHSLTETHPFQPVKFPG